MSPTTMEKLQDIFRAVLELPAGADASQLERTNTEKWDSLAHVSLVAGIESEFGIALDLSESLALTSFGEAEAMLERKGL